MEEQQQNPPEQTPAQKKIGTWLKERVSQMCKGRTGEEREWYRAGMFYQQKQWLEDDPTTRGRIRPIQIGEKTKIPMPTTNHYSDAIDIAANALGVNVPEMLARADNYDSRNRRAAEAAENAIDAANAESGMNDICPTLPVQTVLFGLSITKDTVAFDHSTDEVPQFAPQQLTPQAPQVSPTPMNDAQTGQPAPAINADAPVVNGTPPPPPEPATPQVIGTERIPSPRLKTENPLPFSVYWKRDCVDPNMSPIIAERMRPTLGECREMFPQYVDDDGKSKFSKDEGEFEGSSAEYFIRSLRSLGAVTDDEAEDKCTVWEAWFEWSELSEEEQKALEDEWADTPSQAYPSMQRIEAAVQYGLYCTIYKDDVLEWGENPFDGKKIYTFYLHKRDPASASPGGLSRRLIPLQKKLNRIDSLMELAALSNASVKVLWPTTQTTKPPTGNPCELIMYDPQGDGKVKPELWGGKAYGAELAALRAQTVSDMEALSGSNAAAEGDIPGGGTAFRALAFASSKTEEGRKTQRYLWEAGHERRSRLLLVMCKLVWSQPRKVQTAGFNNRYGAQMIAAADLEGDYELTVIQDSSRPKTETEKLQVLQLLMQGGMISPQSPEVREYVTDTLGVSDLNLIDHLQYVKAERDLELVKSGQTPQSNPFANWSIFFQVFSEYTLTEEYEDLPQQNKVALMGYTQWLQQMGQPPPMIGPGGPPAGPPSPATHPLNKALASKGGVGGAPPSHVLGQVPGAQVSPTQVQGAAEAEAAQVVPSLGQ